MNNGIQIPRSVTINLAVSGAQTQSIGIQSILDGKKVRAVVTHIPGAGDNASNGVAISASLNNAFLKLTNGSNQGLRDSLPLSLLDPKANGMGQLLLIESSVIDWTKSAIIWGSAADAAANNGKIIPLLVIYEA